MKATIEQVLKALEGLAEPDFDVHVIGNAWYTNYALTRALTFDEKLIKSAGPPVRAVRVGLKEGMLELHPLDGGGVDVKCYCCFGGDPDKGVHLLNELASVVASLKDHRCPPWPG